MQEEATLAVADAVCQEAYAIPAYLKPLLNTKRIKYIPVNIKTVLDLRCQIREGHTPLCNRRTASMPKINQMQQPQQ